MQRNNEKTSEDLLELYDKCSQIMLLELEIECDREFVRFNWKAAKDCSRALRVAIFMYIIVMLLPNPPEERFSKLALTVLFVIALQPLIAYQVLVSSLQRKISENIVKIEQIKMS